MQNVLPHVGACKHKIKVEWWRQVHLPGHSGTRLTAYHISQHVASTFKSLATTTTRCDLIHFKRNRQGKPSGHDTTHDPVHYPYSDCRILNKQLLYRASDRKSPNFYRSYLAEHLSDKDLVQYIGFLRDHATRVSSQLLDLMHK
jgi:hypothetical protein